MIVVAMDCYVHASAMLVSRSYFTAVEASELESLGIGLPFELGYCCFGCKACLYISTYSCKLSLECG